MNCGYEIWADIMNINVDAAQKAERVEWSVV